MNGAPSDQDRINDFWAARAERDGVETARFHPEFTPYDMALITPHLAAGRRVLDLGCGTCVLANEIALHHPVHVHAVDYAPGMLRHALPRPNLTTEASDVLTYASDQPFDVILLFGVINYIVDGEARRSLYARCHRMLKPGGWLILKSQLGRENAVFVDTYSEHLAAHYVATYPAVEDEQDMIARYFDVTRSEPYPDSFNRYANTRFFAFHARRKDVLPDGLSP
jgi:2-polyprenyl-3-methyl-5-hydroxy-6-metoxy-1,4-benzoquinol methylase